MAQKILFHPWIRSIRQLSVIVLVTVAVALISNHFRSSPLQLVGNWSQEARLTSPSGRQMAISLDEAKNLHQSKGAVFMDARPFEEFTKGHIQGAISIPWQEAEQRVMDVTADLSNDAVIITYCDGDTCDLSKELSLFLENLGFSKVRILVNGWTVWHDAKLPVETGNQGD
ncbi:MAG: rhodanese-like domain-containing protein [Deltaproteobacteria bacterium]|nr:rhodanese-like domain-containing protein [Deltaproteobacteria bacterium]